MANVDEALGSVGDQPGDDDSLDNQVRRAKEQFAVLERPRLAFIAVDDDERAVILAASAGGADGVADVAPFLCRRDAGAAHAAQVRVRIIHLAEERVGPAAKRWSA